MKIEAAIEEAIRGGWKLPETPFKIMAINFTRTLHPLEVARYFPELAYLDPTFWQSLGKAMGWKDYDEKDRCKECGTKYSPMSGWLINWHRFIDHLAEGKTAEAFFEGL